MRLTSKYRILKRYFPYYLPTDSDAALNTIWKRGLQISHPAFLLVNLLSRIVITFKTGGNSDLGQRLAADRIPKKYYKIFRLDISHNYNRRFEYLYHTSLNHLFRIQAKKRKFNVLSNKLIFFQHCQKHTIITVDVLGSASSSVLTIGPNPPWKRQENFIIKPTIGSQGKGFVLMTYDKKNQSYWHSSDQRHIPINMIEDYITFLSETTPPFIIQKQEKNHLSLNHLGNEYLITLRILSYIDPNNLIQLYRSILQVPQGGAILNYAHKGGTLYSIDASSGKILQQIHTTFSNEKNINLTLPSWNQVITIIKTAHNSLKDIPLIGWDIIFTPEGPKILEGNTQPSLDTHQMHPLGPFEKEFKEVLYNYWNS